MLKTNQEAFQWVFVSKEETIEEGNFEAIPQNSLAFQQKRVDLETIGKLVNCKDIWGYKLQNYIEWIAEEIEI